jgi:hypothetical protein
MPLLQTSAKPEIFGVTWPGKPVLSMNRNIRVNET